MFSVNHLVIVTSHGSSPNFASNINPLSANPTKWSNTLEQFCWVGA